MVFGKAAMCCKSFKALVKRDLFSLAVNPAARVSGVFFTLFCFVNFFIFQGFFLSSAGSTDMRSFFAPMPLLSIVCIPSVTMGLWTSYDRYTVLPVSIFVRVLSKWFSALIFLSFFLLVSVAVPLAASFFGRVEYSVVLTGFLGIVFSFAALSALGLFVSLLFRSKALAFFVSALLCGLVSLIHLGASFSSRAGVQAFLRFISFSRHFDAAGKGIIDSRDLLFFAGLTLLFLSLGAFSVEYGRYSAASESPHKKALSIQYAALFLLSLFIVWNGRIFYFRADMTADRRFSLSEAGKAPFVSLESPLRITYYLSPELESAYPAVKEVREFLYNYADLSKDIAVRTVRVKNAQAQKEAQAAGIFPEVLDTSLLFGARYEEGEGRQTLVVYSGILLEYEDKSVPIPFVLTPFNVEFNMADALPLLNGSGELGAPRRRVSLLIANGLSLERDYPYLVPWLEGAGFTVDLILPDMIGEPAGFGSAGGKSDFSNSVLRQNQPLLLIGSSALNEAQCEVLDNFFTSGGSVLCAVSAHEADFTTWTLSIPAYNPFLSLLKKRGISVLPPIAGDANCAQISMLRRASGQPANGMQGYYGDSEVYEKIAYPFFVKIGAASAAKNHPLTASFGGLDLFWPSYMETDKNVLARTSERARLLYPQEGFYNTDPFSLADFIPEEAPPVLSRKDAKTVPEAGFPVLCAADADSYGEGGEASFAGGRMIVIPDQYFLSRMVEYTNAMYNFDLAVNALLWLSGEEDLLSIKNRAFGDYRVKASNSSEFAHKARTTLILLFAWFCTVFAAVILLLRFYRKKRRFKALAEQLPEVNASFDDKKGQK